jgi:CRISPR/Cas system type I-B associated protein Csh2 (Cas7 group RAMP superfamily)
MEHPIQQPSMGMSTDTVLSNDLIEKAARLMNTNAKGDQINESKPRQQAQQVQTSSSLSANQIREIVRETVQDVLKENGLLVESESNSGEMFKFRVGQHLFEGKVLKVKKIAK